MRTKYIMRCQLSNLHHNELYKDIVFGIKSIPLGVVVAGPIIMKPYVLILLNKCGYDIPLNKVKMTSGKFRITVYGVSIFGLKEELELQGCEPQEVTTFRRLIA